MKDINISVIIPSYNSKETIGLCLDSLKNQLHGAGYEVIVVDCTSGGTVDGIVAGYPDIVFIKEHKRFNSGIGRNIGAKIAKGEVIVFLDSDVTLESNALAKIWTYYKKGYKVFGGALEPNLHFGFSWAGIVKHYFFNHENQKRRWICQREDLSSALLIFDKKIFYDIGWFKDMPRMEDTELTMRMGKCGVKVFFIPEIIGYQIQETCFSRILKEAFISGNNYFFIKYGDEFTLRKRLILGLSLPLIIFVHAIRTNIHNMAHNGVRGNLIGLITAPVVFYCWIYWALGSYKAVFLNQGISNER